MEKAFPVPHEGELELLLRGDDWRRQPCRQIVSGLWQ